LFLSLLGGHATAGKPQPDQHLFWPEGTELNVGFFTYHDTVLAKFGISATWPLAPGADHYRLTWVVRTVPKNQKQVLLDVSPLPYGISPD
jgi:hypothetical protein